ncbi:hypothetical protein M378DRAFT_356575 [Amanita muscaria Koide BX008]|uniref:Uncharacterized protein n=1 Tax=Amanita muscaria (strain Koide BX008) TaxID=946122 RepID=A0A0C2S5E9_AMAMK|nr:hypothetical protein M378DRAFT_356575 [Amanita muscaria Koide BX008]
MQPDFAAVFAALQNARNVPRNLRNLITARPGESVAADLMDVSHYRFRRMTVDEEGQNTIGWIGVVNPMSQPPQNSIPDGNDGQDLVQRSHEGRRMINFPTFLALNYAVIIHGSQITCIRTDVHQRTAFSTLKQDIDVDDINAIKRSFHIPTAMVSQAAFNTVVYIPPHLFGSSSRPTYLTPSL